jgi:hypothetical protein
MHCQCQVFRGFSPGHDPGRNTVNGLPTHVRTTAYSIRGTAAFTLYLSACSDDASHSTTSIAISIFDASVASRHGRYEDGH